MELWKIQDILRGNFDLSCWSEYLFLDYNEACRDLGLTSGSLLNWARFQVRVLCEIWIMQNPIQKFRKFIYFIFFIGKIKHKLVSWVGNRSSQTWWEIAESWVERGKKKKEKKKV